MINEKNSECKQMVKLKGGTYNGKVKVERKIGILFRFIMATEPSKNF